MLEESGEDFHHPGIEPAFVGRQAVPLLHVGIVAGQFGVRRHQLELLLLFENLGAVGIPAGVELAGVPVGPLFGDVVRRMHGSGSEVQEKRLVRRDLFGVGDHRPGPVHEIRGEVVALLRGGLGFGLGVVAHQLGVVLVGVATEESVVALESPPQRPPLIGPGGGHRLLRGQVPLAHAVGVVAAAAQDLRQEPVLERNVAVGSGIAGGSVGQARQVVGVVVTAGEDARARRRTQRGGVHVRKHQPVGGQCVDVRCRDGTSVTAEMAEAHVVDDDEHHVRGAVGGPRRSGPGRCGLVGGAADRSRERGARPILNQCHGSAPSGCGRG